MSRSGIDLAREAGLSTAVVAYFEAAQVKWNPGRRRSQPRWTCLSRTLRTAWLRGAGAPPARPAQSPTVIATTIIPE